MKAVGLIVEYNPFHNGHLYHLQKAKEITGADVVVAVMSGNFVQRGEPALLDKWTRSNIALKNGVDLVVELPVFYAVQPSHLFAKGAVEILASLGVSDIVCGVEHEDVDWLNLAKNAPDANDLGEEAVSDKTKTFATQYAESLYNVSGFELKDPNDILAFGYAKALLDLELDEKIQLHGISRVVADYRDTEINDQKIASASSIRLAFHKDKFEKIEGVVPNETLVALQEKTNTANFDQNFWNYLEYRLLTDTAGQLGQVYQMGEGIEHRFLSVVRQDKRPKTLQGFIKAVKTKRYTYSRIQRMLFYTLLNVKVDQMQAAMNESYIRLLGFNNVGKDYLNNVKKTTTLPIISKVDMSLAKSNLRLDYKAGQLWNLLADGEKKPAQDVSRVPLFLEN